MEENSRYKILTIDDEAYVRQSIANYLEDYNFIICEAESGEKGLEVFEKESSDLVILDLRMPEMDGLKVLEILRKQAPDLPIIVVSGTGNISDVVKALQLGAWDYILKPIEDMNVLYYSIKKCIKDSQLIKYNSRYQEKLEELVTDRTLELQASERRYKAVFEHTGTAAVIIESNDIISMVNSKFCEFAQMDSQQIENKKTWHEFIAPEYIETIQNFIKAKVNLKDTSAPPLQAEAKFISSSGEEKIVFISLGVIPISNQVVVSLLDVTDKKQAEQRWQALEKQLRKSQKMEAIGTLAGGIAHDLNNILSPVLGYADMIMRASDPSTKEYQRSQKIQQAALRAADLVSQVLSVNRRKDGEKRLIKIHPVTKEVLKLLRGSLPTTIGIVDNINRNCGMVEADPTQIHQVVMNLCTNAYHAMEDSGGTLTVSLKELALSPVDMMEYPNLVNGQGTYLALEVEDTGCGMTDDIVDRIFDPYFTTKEEGKGTGLGLSTVYNIVKSCKGDIKVVSNPSGGTTFTIILPVVEINDQKDDSRLFEKSYVAGAGERILVVDDEEDIAHMCKEGFELLGYKVDKFISSLQALEFFKNNYHDIDVVITDQTMPEMTGIELAEQIKSIDDSVPIILCSGYTGSVTKSKMDAAGINHFMMKPVTVQGLTNEIQNLLNKKSA